MCQVNADLKLLVKEGDTGIFLSMSLTGNLLCYSWKVINLHCERILLRVATLPCKVHYMEMLQAIKQKWQICVHFKLNFHYSSSISSPSLLLGHLRSYFHRTWKLTCTGNLKEISRVLQSFERHFCPCSCLGIFFPIMQPGAVKRLQYYAKILCHECCQRQNHKDNNLLNSFSWSPFMHKYAYMFIKYFIRNT